MASAVGAEAVPQLRSAARVLIIGIPLAVAAGLTLPLQARTNGELGQRLQDPLLAGLFSFGGAALVMAAATLIIPSGRTAFVRRPQFGDSQIDNARRLIEAGEPASMWPGTWACPGPPYTAR